MASSPANRIVAFLVANDGVGEVELTHPWQAVQSMGQRPVLVAPDRGLVQIRLSPVLVAAFMRNPLSA